MTALRAGRHRKSRRHARGIGTSPATIEPQRDAAQTQVTWHLYGPDGYSATATRPQARADQFLWIDICGMQDHAAIAAIANGCGMSDLGVAELFHLDQRASTDIDGDLVSSVLRMPASGPPFEADQVTLVLGPAVVLTVREGPRDCFEPVRKRLSGGTGRIRASSPYLFYALVDAIVDSYFPILEGYGDLVEQLEERVLTKPDDRAMRDIHLLKRELLDLRHALWPMREALAALLRDDMPQIEDPLLPYLRDCLDHAFQLLDMVEVYRETAQGLVDLQLSSLSNRMNEIMKVLTMIATVFIPMTFISGLYGMNFDRASPYNLPELGWRFGYFYALGLMLASAGAMAFVFWRLGWIFQRRPRTGDENR